MKTGIFIDIDGTLINDDKMISPLDKREIKSLSNNEDINVYLITGKSESNAVYYYNELGLKTKLVSSAGQIITNPSDNTKFNLVYTNISNVNKVISYLKTKNIVTNFLIEGNESKYYMDNVEISNLSTLVTGNDKIQKYRDGCITNIIGTYIEVQHISEVDLTKLTKKLKKMFSYFDVSYWLTDNHHPVLHLKPSNIGKSIAMKMIAKEDSLDKTISFGNGWIDVNMIKASDIGYAMLNAVDKIKDAADAVTKYDNNNSGVGRELHKLFNNM